MSQQVIRKVCTCDNCGNEAEMTITCSIEPEESKSQPTEAEARTATRKEKTLGHAVCSQCGSEADIWLDM